MVLLVSPSWVPSAALLGQSFLTLASFGVKSGSIRGLHNYNSLLRLQFSQYGDGALASASFFVIVRNHNFYMLSVVGIQKRSWPYCYLWGKLTVLLGMGILDTQQHFVLISAHKNNVEPNVGREDGEGRIEVGVSPVSVCVMFVAVIPVH